MRGGNVEFAHSSSDAHATQFSPGVESLLAANAAVEVIGMSFLPLYDDFFPEQLWGKNLAIFFDEIFRKKARFCVMFVSKEYQQRVWTIHEARSAQPRALPEKVNEYILPIHATTT